MGTTRLQSATKHPATLASKTKLPCMHVSFKKPIFNNTPNFIKNQNFNKNPTSHSSTHSSSQSSLKYAVNIVHSARKLRGVLQIKMSALRSEHKLLQEKTLQEKIKISTEYNNLSRIENGMEFVKNEVEGIMKNYLDPWICDPAGQMVMMRVSSPDFIGDVFVRTMLENFLSDLRNY